MGMVVQHNLNALNAYNKLNVNVAGLKKASEKLSSGYRINRAGDDAAGLAISEKMRSQIRGLNQAKRNAQDGISMIQTFEGAAQETHTILQRMKELATESANGTYDNRTDRAAIQLEFDQLNDELNQLADTDFNGTVVLNGGEMADGLKTTESTFGTREFNYKDQYDARAEVAEALKNATDHGALVDNKHHAVDNSLYDKTAADSVWKTIGLGKNPDENGDFLEADTTQVQQIEITFTAVDDGNGGVNWVATGAANARTEAGELVEGFDYDSLTLDKLLTTNSNDNGNIGSGGFSIDAATNADGTNLNVVFDTFTAKAGDTMTVLFENVDATTHAPNNKGITEDSIKFDDSIDGNPTIGNPSFKLDAKITDENMTKEMKQAFDDLNAAKFTITYKADAGDPTLTKSSIAVAGDSKAVGTLNIDDAGTVTWTKTGLASPITLGKVTYTDGADVEGTPAVIPSVTTTPVAGGITPNSAKVVDGDGTPTASITGTGTVSGGTLDEAAFATLRTSMVGNSETGVTATSTSLTIKRNAAGKWMDPNGNGNEYFADDATLQTALGITLSSPANGDVLTLTIPDAANAITDADLTFAPSTATDANVQKMTVGQSITLTYDATASNWKVSGDVNDGSTVSTLADYGITLGGTALLKEGMSFKVTAGGTATASKMTASIDNTFKFEDVSDLARATTWKFDGTDWTGTYDDDSSSADALLTDTTKLTDIGINVADAIAGDVVKLSAYVPATAANGTVTFGINVKSYDFVDDSKIQAHAVATDESAKPTVDQVIGAANDPSDTRSGAHVSDSNAFKNSTAILNYEENIILQVGSRSKDAVNFTFEYNKDGTADMGDLVPNLNISARKGGLETDQLSLATADDANYAIDQIDKAINKVSMVRASFGAIQNRLDYKIENLTTTSENLTEAESNIRDTDMASEMMNYTKYNILQQAAQSMLAQANQQPQSVLQLLG